MNIEEQLSAVLNDPEAMNKISSIIGALGGGAAQNGQSVPAQQPAAPQPVQNSGGLQLPDVSGDNRTKLLMAIKPFLSEKRAPYVDGAVTILKMMQLGKLGKDLKLF